MKSGISPAMLILALSGYALPGIADDNRGTFPGGPFFGQIPPHHAAEVVVDGFISKKGSPQMNAAFSRDGREFLYCARDRGSWDIFVSREQDGVWAAPEPLPFSSSFSDRDFTMAPDGNTICFGSNRPRKPGGSRLTNLDIYCSTRTADGSWRDPENVGPIVNTDAGENYPSVAANGNLYFFSCRDDGFGGCDLYLSRFENGMYQPPVNLGRRINSPQNDWDAFVAPDESYIIFSSQDRPDTLGTQDLYIAYRQGDGGWTPAVNMGPRVNSADDEICPSVSLDGKLLFFTSRRRGAADIYWMTTDVIWDLKSKHWPDSAPGN